MFSIADNYNRIRASDSSHSDVIKWNLFSVTGPLWGKSTGHRWLPITKASDAEFWCFPLFAIKRMIPQHIHTFYPSLIYQISGRICFGTVPFIPHTALLIGNPPASTSLNILPRARFVYSYVHHCFCLCPIGLLPDTSNRGCVCAGNAGNILPATAGKRSRHASRHVRDVRAVMHAGIAN